MRTFILLIVVSLPILLFAQGVPGDAGIEYTLANGFYSVDAGVTYFEFDIMARATPIEQGNLTRLGDGMIHLYYNTAAFGIDLLLNGNVTVTKGTLVYNPYYPVYGFNVVDTNDINNETKLLGLSWWSPDEPGFGTLVPGTPTQLWHLKFKVLDTSEEAWVCFWDTEMAGEQYYDDHIHIYVPVIANTCFYLDPPLPVELSSFSATFSTDMYVKLTWITQSETNMTGYYILRSPQDELANAQTMSPLIPATNTSDMQVYEYTDRELYDNGTYYYWLECVEQGNNTFNGPVTVNFENTYIPPVDIPSETALAAVFPNPFNPYAFIPFTVGKDKGATEVQIMIYNSRGQMVFSDDLGVKQPGSYTDYSWDGRDNNGLVCSTGLYMIRMIAGKENFLRKVVLIK